MRSTCNLILSVSLVMISMRLSAQTVNPLTGRASVSIPLGSIASEDLGESASLSHHGGALRVAESAGSAGMGWNLNIGGQIVREVRGLPDDYDGGVSGLKGWLINGNAGKVQSFAITADDNLTTCADEQANWTSIRNNSFDYLNDSEPDIYYFSAPGISGKFIYGADGLPKLIPFQDLTISRSLNSFVIKTNSGITYTFGETSNIRREAKKAQGVTSIRYFEKDYARYQKPISFVQSWHLTDIRSAVSGLSMQYQYELDREEESARQVAVVYPVQTNDADTLFYISETYQQPLVNKVTLGALEIRVEWRRSIAQKVTFIDTETGDKRQYELRYKDVKSGHDLMDPVRPFLAEVYQSNLCTNFPSFSFTYHDVNLSNFSNNDPTGRAVIPWDTGWGQDYFGYFNGKKDNRNVPTVYFYANESGARRLRLTPIPNTTATTTLVGGDMTVSSTFNRFGALSRIDYPTGGWVEFEYEGNRFFDGTTNEELPGPGVRVKTIRQGGGGPSYGRPIEADPNIISRSYAYTLNGGQSSGRIVNPPAFAFIDKADIMRTQQSLADPSEVIYAQVRETIQGQGYRVYEYEMPAMFPQVAPTAPFSKIARAAGAPCAAGQMRNGSYTFPFAPADDLGFTRGQLRRMREYSEAGTLTSEKRFAFAMPQANSVVKALAVEKTENLPGDVTFHYSLYAIPVAQSKIVATETNLVVADGNPADSTKTLTTYTYNGKNLIRQIATTNADGSIDRRFMKYAMDYAVSNPLSTDLQAVALLALNNAGRGAELIEQTSSFQPVGTTVQTTTAGSLVFFQSSGSFINPVRELVFTQNKPYTVSTIAGSPQTFSFNSNYLLNKQWEFENGQVRNVIDIGANLQSFHISAANKTPLATFINCRAENAVFDGFEYIHLRGLPTDNRANEGRTGNRSAKINRLRGLTSNTIVKAGNTYRVAMWVKSQQATTLTIKAGSGSTAPQLNLSYDLAGQWQYLESLLPMSAVGPSFVLAIETSSGPDVLIDDVVALPESARVSHAVVYPFTGTLGKTDDRGRSVVFNYDSLGRLVTTLDNQRNLLEVKEYGYAKPANRKLSSEFSFSSSTFLVGQGITMSGIENCVAQLLFLWTIEQPNGTTVSLTGKTITWVPVMPGNHKIKMVVSTGGYAPASAEVPICVRAKNITSKINASGSTIFKCAPVDDGNRTFTIALTNEPDLSTGWEARYVWTVRDINGALVPGVSGGGAAITVINPHIAYTVSCVVAFSRPVPTYPFEPCNQSFEVAPVAVSISYVDNSPCK